ncbi:MAG: MarC family protein [Gammaproteobacteria bacterium]
MSFDYIQLFKQFIALIVVLAPLDVIPLYLSLTQGMTGQQRHQVLVRMIIAVIITLFFFQASGLYLFTLMGVTLPSFQVAGGLILASMAWSMLHATHSRIQTTRSEGQESLARDDFSIVPLAIPMLAGPGAITTVILFTEQYKGTFVGHIQLSAVILSAALTLYVLFRTSGPLFDKLGVTGTRITTRIMGMLLLALAMEFILRGISATLFPAR